MNERRNQDAERKHEIVKHSLEGAALVALTGLAYKLVLKDGRYRRYGVEPGDLINSVVVKALSKAEQFRGDAQITTWIHRIAVRTSIDEVEKISNQLKKTVSDSEGALLEVPDTTVGPEQSALVHEEHAKLMDHLSVLSEIQHLVIFKFYFEDKTYEQIAEELEIPVGTVKSHASRGLAQLRKEYGISDETAA